MKLQSYNNKSEGKFQRTEQNRRQFNKSGSEMCYRGQREGAQVEIFGKDYLTREENRRFVFVSDKLKIITET
jgi:hypothetical protein